MNYQIGQKIEIKEKYRVYEMSNIGIIRQIPKRDGEMIGIEFGRDFPGGHSLKGRLNNSRDWYFFPSSFKVVETEWDS